MGGARDDDFPPPEQASIHRQRPGAEKNDRSGHNSDKYGDQADLERISSGRGKPRKRNPGGAQHHKPARNRCEKSDDQ